MFDQNFNNASPTQQLIIKLLFELIALEKKRLHLQESIPVKRGYMKLPEVSAHTTLSISTLRAHIRKGNLITTKPSRSHLVSIEKLQIFMDKFCTNGPAQSKMAPGLGRTETTEQKSSEGIEYEKGRYKDIPSEDYYNKYEGDNS